MFFLNYFEGMTTVMGGALLVNCMNMCINMHTVYQEYSLPI